MWYREVFLSLEDTLAMGFQSWNECSSVSNRLPRFSDSVGSRIGFALNIMYLISPFLI